MIYYVTIYTLKTHLKWNMCAPQLGKITYILTGLWEMLLNAKPVVPGFDGSEPATR